MYERIVVALDGSEVAEQILPHVAALAQKFGSAVTLLRATTPAEALLTGSVSGADPVAGSIIDPEPTLAAERQEASEYFAALDPRLRDHGLTADYQLIEGPAAEVIFRYAAENGADLIAITTHGRGGIGRLVVGSVADRVIRHAPCPLLVLRVVEEDREHEEPDYST